MICLPLRKAGRQTIYASGLSTNIGSNLFETLGSSAGSATNEEKERKSLSGYDYDLVVIGGGSGGLACGKAASELGAKVALLDAVKPSPQNSTWGLGGTCVNVGCIPKKLMHQAGLLGGFHSDAKAFCWEFSSTEEPKLDWSALVEKIGNYIRSLNFGYVVQLREKNVEYINNLGRVADEHTVDLLPVHDAEMVGETEPVRRITAQNIVIAVGGRPKQLECPGGELAITSDDIFWKKDDPGKVLVVGASYIALECAGFLTSFGRDVTVMARSILLRGFDQDMAQKVGQYMEDNGTKFLHGKVPTRLSKTDSGKILVEWDGGSDTFDTVLAAIGRHPDTENLGLESLGVETSADTGRILTKEERTSVPSIYAIGDVQEGHLELTPIAIESGKLLAKRLYGGSKAVMDYRNVCTTIFTPLEYGSCGLSEEDATESFGDEAVDVYHTYFTPLEWTLPENREYNQCYVKVIVNRSDNDRVVGFHILSPNAGEIAQGFGIGMKLGMRFQDLSELVGIHPTIAEELTLLTITKKSGKTPMKTGC